VESIKTGAVISGPGAKTKEKAPVKAEKAGSTSKELGTVEADMQAAMSDTLKGLLNMAAGDKELNVSVDVTVRFEK
jgi:hypothetical protein